MDEPRVRVGSGDGEPRAGLDPLLERDGGNDPVVDAGVFRPLSDPCDGVVGRGIVHEHDSARAWIGVPQRAEADDCVVGVIETGDDDCPG